MSVRSSAALADALVRHQHGELSQAARPYQAIIANDPTNTDRCRLAGVLLELNQREEALACLPVGGGETKKPEQGRPGADALTMGMRQEEALPGGPATTRGRMFLLREGKESRHPFCSLIREDG